ncbi:MAG TPA: TIGR03960 family B12-binding radical SAM protein [Deltaproteobacteria bacterium]|nr:TIGR03960 family B12-binding radical SAM protein [Deltaproteobacteria bacterium]
MNNRAIDRLLALVERPSRYIGGEVNSIRKDHSRCELTFGLAFPDAYEVGMSHLGLQILYSILNDETSVAAERFFAPWPDMERLLRQTNTPLMSLESQTPLNRFDIIGFSLQYELSYTNVIAMLELGGVPIFASDRGSHDPLVIAGGPCAFNPEPVAPFFDAIVIGEGEDVITDITRTVTEGKKKGYRRNDFLAVLALIDGVYVPSVHRYGEIITKRTVSDINNWPVPEKPIVPSMKTIHDRVTLEIARGCSRGCRFCQAGMVWRPTRERIPELLGSMAENMLCSTGHDELSLLSLSSGDYSLIESLLTMFMNRYHERKIALALPSMRVETLTGTLIDQIKRVRKTSFTLAPEAGTQRLRNVINKGNTEENLIATTKRVFDAGWKSVKLYFMIGLPTETDDDLAGITDLAYKVLKEGGKKRQLTVSLSTFIPKPHTPFQWHRQISLQEIQERQDFFKKTIRHRNINLRWHDGRMSLLEGILSRGDRKIASLILKAYEQGCRFDGWGDQFRFERWQQALTESNIAIDDYLRERDVDERLPWDKIDCGLDKSFLLEEYHKSFRGDTTEDCRFGNCHRCGVCDKERRIILAADLTEQRDIPAPSSSIPKDPAASEKKFRIQFAKQGTGSLLSHLETTSVLIRAITRSGLSFVFTDGFHPHPKVSFGLACPVGTESMCEFADMHLKNPPEDINDWIRNINDVLPDGLEVLNITKLDPSAPPLSAAITGYRHTMYLPEDALRRRRDTMEDTINAFLAQDEWIVTKEKKGKQTCKNIRPFVTDLKFNENDRSLVMTSRVLVNGGVNPWEILKNVIGIDDETAKLTRIVKTAPILSDGKNHHGKRNDF